MTGKVTGPPYKGHKDRASRVPGSVSSLDSSFSEAASVELRPSKHYNKWYVDAERKQAMEKIIEENAKIEGKKEIKKTTTTGSSIMNSAGNMLKGSFKVSNSKVEAIRDWEARQRDKESEKGLFATMDAKYGQSSDFGSRYGGWGESPKPKEVIRTVYIPVRDSRKEHKEIDRTSSGKESRTASLSPYSDRRSKRLYPRCPSPETDDELDKIRNWIEYNEDGREYSVDTPTVLQSTRSRSSSSALGTLFEGFNENDSYIESDEINIREIDSEYEADNRSSDEEQFRSYTDESEAEKACRLTRSYNLATPKGRRCPKAKIDRQTTGTTTDSSIGKPRPPSVLRLRGGAKSGSSSDNGAMEITDIDHAGNEPGTSGQTPRHTPENFLKRNSAIIDYMGTVSPARKRNRENSKSPGQPESETDMAISYSRRGRNLMMHFEKFKASYKKKLTAAAQSELDVGVEMINELITDIYAENMCIFGRYLELKDAAVDNRKRVDFASPLPKQKERFERITEEIQTSDTDTEGPKKNRRRRKKKSVESQAQSSGAETAQSGTDTGAATSGTEGSRPGSRNKSKKKEKEILEKCREQDAPIKFVVTTGDKTAEETKKILWTQVVAKNKAPKIKQTVVLQGGDLLITPADEDTRTAMESLVKEGFGITKTGARLPRLIVYDVDRSLKPDELPGTIVSQNPELELTEEDRLGITPSFKTGPKESDIVHWVCEVKPETFAKLNEKRLYIGYSVCRAKEYLNITICNKCQKFGHIAAKCKETVDTCSHCAEKGHRVENCSNKDKQPKCANCKGPYTARHMGCTFRAQQVRNLVRNTTYN